jgi:hypothetical protein
MTDDFGAYKTTEAQDAANETDDDEPSTTFIEFNSRDHPTAYSLANGQGDLRGLLGSDIHDFYAMATPGLADYVMNDQPETMLELLGFEEDRASELADELRDE